MLLVTDSARVIHQTRQYPDFLWRHVRVNRTSIGGPPDTNLGTRSRGERTYIEDRANAGLLDSAYVIAASIADVQFASQACYVRTLTRTSTLTVTSTLTLP